MAEKATDCGYTPNTPVEENPSRSPSDTAKTKSKDLGDTRASFDMATAQDIGERVKKYENSN